MANRWMEESGGRQADRAGAYAARIAKLAASGAYLHGEADFVSSLEPCPASVLDAGCGTGRVGIELARRGIDVVGVDIDTSMLAVARAEAPADASSLLWIEADLADPALDLGGRFDTVLAAGNVMIFLAPGTEHVVVTTLARHLAPGGALVAGFQLQPGRLTLAEYDAACAAAGLTLTDRWATWERRPWVDGGDYAVSVHAR